MDTEYSKIELQLRGLSEKRNPYNPECPNRHLWNEGFLDGFAMGMEDSNKLVESWEAVKMLRLDEYHILKESYDRLLEINSDLVDRLSWSNTFISNESVVKFNQESLDKVTAFVGSIPKTEEQE